MLKLGVVIRLIMSIDANAYDDSNVTLQVVLPGLDIHVGETDLDLCSNGEVAKSGQIIVI